MPIIIPALLTNDLDDFKKKLTAVNDVAEWIQIDITDGKFVPSHTIQPEEIITVARKPRTEVHLMVNDPVIYLDDCRLAYIQTVLFHLESAADPHKVISSCRGRGLGVGIVLNPGTPIEHALPFDQEVDVVQLMGITPGYYGRPFIPETIERLKQLRATLKRAMLEIDGGVNVDNIVEVAKTGLDRIVVGSAVFNTPNPVESLSHLQSIIDH